MTNSKARKRSKKNLLRNLYYWTLKQAETPYADWFIGLYSFLESIIIPLPTDPLLLARATAKPKLALWISFYVTITSVAGAFFGYFIGMFFWESLSPLIYSYIFSEQTFNMVVERVHDSTFLFILFGAFSPLPFKAFSLSAGSMGLALVPFALGTLIGRGVRYFTLGMLIYFFGDSIKEFIDKRLESLFLIAGLIVFLLLAFKIWLM